MADRIMASTMPGSSTQETLHRRPCSLCPNRARNRRNASRKTAPCSVLPRATRGSSAWRDSLRNGLCRTISQGQPVPPLYAWPRSVPRWGDGQPRPHPQIRTVPDTGRRVAGEQSRPETRWQNGRLQTPSSWHRWRGVWVTASPGSPAPSSPLDPCGPTGARRPVFQHVRCRRCGGVVALSVYCRPRLAI